MKRKPKRRTQSTRFRPKLETLELRRVLAAAIDLASITGRVFDDFTGNGFNAGEEVANASLTLYLDDGDGVFEPTSGDSNRGTTQTNANGQYSFDRLTAGNYFVQQPGQTVGGTTLQSSVSSLITISNTAVQGQIVVPIDTFDTTQQVVRDETNDGVPVTSSVMTPDAIGGERDLFVNKTSVNGAVQLSIDDPLLPNLLTFDSILSGNGERRISWDGPDGDATSIDDTGLNNLDLTSGATADGVSLQVGSDQSGGTAIVRLYTDDSAGGANRFSTASVSIPDTGGAPSSPEFLDFSSFMPTSGGGADFTNIGAIELEIAGAANINGTAELVGTLGPNLFTRDFDNFETADLAVTKTVNDTSPNTNQNVTFTITVNNNGPDNASGINVTDQLPNGITYVSDSPSQGTYNSGTGIWNVGSIANGSAATLSIVGRVTSANPNLITNTAQITASDQTDSNAANNQSSASLTPEQIDIGLTKQVNNTTPNLGENVTFTITASNLGPSNATNVVITDAIPSGLSFVNATASSGSYNSATGIWNVGSIVNGGNATLSLVTSVISNGSLSNTASFTSADQSDSNVGNNQASASLQASIADLSLTKSVSNSSANVGDNVTFTVNVSNAGPDVATGVAVTDLLPAGMSLVNFSPSVGAYNAGTGIWTIGTIAPGTVPSLNIVARVDSIGAKVNTAQISASGQSDPDSTPGNSVPGEDDQASATVSPAVADLSLVKEANNLNPNVGENVTFMINVTNTGPSNATDVVVLDALPAGMTYVSDNSGGAYNPGTGLWNIGTVTAGQSRMLSLVARVDSIAALTNTARIQSVNEFDPDSSPGNDVPAEDDQDSVSLSPASADLSLTKSVNNASPNVNEQITFTVTVTNSGPNTATNVTVQDQLPAGTSFVSATTSQGNFNQASGLWTVGSIGSGANATLSIVAVANTTGLATNTAQVMTVDQTDPDSTPGNGILAEDDQASAEITATQVDLSLTKTVDNTSPNVGSQVIFTITASNAGPSTATGVVVTESLPTGVTLINSSPSQGSFNINTGAWSVGSLAAGSQATINLTARVDAAGTGVNTAQVTAADQFDVDSTPANNNASEDDQASISFTTPIADLSLAKSVSNSSPNVGDTVSFNVTLTNSGPDNAAGVVVQDVLPAGMTFVSNNLSAGSFDSTTGLWTVGGLANGASATLEILARVDSQGEKTNSARVIASDQSDPDSTPGNDISSEDDQASANLSPATVDVSLTKTVSTARPVIGENVTFTITAANAGPDAASGVSILDVLPTGLSFVGSTPSSGAYNAGTGIWNVGNIASGTNATLDIIARVDTLGDKTNSAEVTALDQFDIDSTAANNVPAEDDQASVVVSPASADLSLTKTVSDPSPNVGQSITYTLTLANAGPDAAANVMVRDTLPAGVTFQSSSPSIGSYDPNTRVWTIPSAAVGSNATLQINALVDTAGDKTNSAEIIASSQLDPDSTPDNNIASEDDQASALLSPELVDLALAKSVDNAAPNLGDTITYTLTIDNDGPSTATGVEVTDLLPAGLTFINATQSTGTYNSATGVWSVGEVAVGAMPTLTINATVGNTRGETNSAEITRIDQPDVDSTPGNNVVGEDDQASTTFTTQIADLALTKIVNNDTPSQTDEVIFTLALSNAGPDAATDIIVNDLLPSGLRFVSSTPSVGSYDGTTGEWSVANLGVGASANLQIRAAVTSATPTTNIAEIASVRQFDPDSSPGNGLASEDDYATAMIMPRVVDVSVSASVDNPEPLEGDTIQVVFTAQNAGPSDATDVNLQTLLPLGLTLISSQPQVGTYDSVTGAWDVGSLGSGASAQLILNARVDTRGIKTVPIQVTSTNEFDVDSTPANNIDAEDDQTELLIRAPRLLNKRLFMSR